MLDINQLRYTYQPQHQHEHPMPLSFNFSLQQGDIAALIGPSGAAEK